MNAMELSTYGDEGAVYALAYAVANLGVATVLILANKRLILRTSFNCPIFAAMLARVVVRRGAIAWMAIKTDPKRGRID